MKSMVMPKLVCPMCKGQLMTKEDEYSCVPCNQTFKSVHGIPNFLPTVLFEKFNGGIKTQDLHEEQDFYQNLFSTMDGLDDGHCVVYGYERIYEFMDDIPRGTILDVGCGAGHHSKDLAQMGFDVTAIDISANGLLQGQKIAESTGVDVNFMLADSENLPFPDKSFDVVFCSLILHHFPQKERVLSEIARVCKTHMFAFEVNSYEPTSFIRFNILNPTIGISGITKNQRTVSPLKLKKALIDLGFEEPKIKYLDIRYNLGKEAEGFVGKLLTTYQKCMTPLPEMFRSNKFLLKCQKN